jgi:hypothetical protein
MDPTNDVLDLDRFRLPPNRTAPAKPKRKPPRYCKSEFLRGPIPWPWLATAMKLPGRALAVALILWREAGIRKVMTVPLPPARLRQCGILPDAARRGLRALEQAGLLTIRRPPGRCLEVTILDAPAENGKPT